MAKYRGKKSLYEVIRQSQLKSGQGKQVNKQDTQADKQESSGKGEWPKKPPLFYALRGRVEFSLPYTGLAAVILAAVLVVLLAYRLGQRNAINTSPEAGNNSTAVPADTRQEETPPAERTNESETGNSETQEASEKVSADTTQPVESETQESSTGDNRIVIQTCPTRRPLEPVVKYFAEHNIETEIMKIGNRYFLLTKASFENPGRKGTDGYKMRERIVELGADYESPPGYASFGEKPFYDAYGMKFDN